MSRDLNASTLAVIGNTNLHIFHLVTFYFAPPFRLTDHQHDLTYDFGSGAETFLATGRLASTSNFEERMKISNPSISITLTGANSADISLALTENFNNARVVVYRGIFDSSGNTASSNIIADPFIVFDGRVTSYSIDDDPLSGESAVVWEIASHWADWDKISGRKCNNEDVQGVIDPDGTSPYSLEQGFSHTFDQIGDKSWGRIRS